MHALLSDPGGDPTRSPYRGLGLLPSALFTASAFSSLGWGGLSFRPRLISYFEAQSHGLPSRYTRLRTPRYRDARGFATVLPGLRLWTGRTCRCLPTHRLGNVNEFHSPPYIPSFRVYLGARIVEISDRRRALTTGRWWPPFRSLRYLRLEVLPAFESTSKCRLHLHLAALPDGEIEMLQRLGLG